MTITIRPDFGTDNGPPCTCGGTIYTYQVPERGNVTVQCNGCHCYDYLPVQDTQPRSAAECSALHRSCRPIADKLFLWYVSPQRRITGRGLHEQDAFTRLDQKQRAWLTNREFCVELSEQRQATAPYSELLRLYKIQHEAMAEQAEQIRAKQSTVDIAATVIASEKS